jgi:hypothetical protein
MDSMDLVDFVEAWHRPFRRFAHSTPLAISNRLCEIS